MTLCRRACGCERSDDDDENNNNNNNITRSANNTNFADVDVNGAAANSSRARIRLITRIY